MVALGHLHARAITSEIDLDQPVAYVFQFDAGLARRVRAYLDPQKALEAAGLRE